MCFVLLNKKLIFAITNHALEKWKTRVDDRNYLGLKSKEDLVKYMQKMYEENKIERLFGDFFLINNDIIAVMKIADNNTFVVITFYGRRSRNPLLYNLKVLLKGRKKYGNVMLDLWTG